MKKKPSSYDPCELEIILFGKSDLIQTSGLLDFDGDGDQGPPSDSWT